MARHPVVVLITLGAALGAARLASAQETEPASEPAPEFGLGEVVRQATYSFMPGAGGGAVAEQPSYVATASGRAIDFEPMRGRHGCAGEPPDTRLPASPLRLETASIRRDLDFSAASGHAVDPDGSVAIDHGVAVERWTAVHDGVEQRWELTAPPAGQGPLVIEVAAIGQAFLAETQSGLHFRDAAAELGTSYGVATWIDAAGERTTLRPGWDGERIVVVVPEELVDRSEYPVVLDPSVKGEYEIDDPIATVAEIGVQRDPDVAWNGVAGANAVYLVVWTDQRCAGNDDVRGIRVNANGAALEPKPLPIAYRAERQKEPAVAFDRSAGKFLVVFEDEFDDAVAGNADVWMRHVRATLPLYNLADDIDDLLPDAAIEVTASAASPDDDQTPDVACVASGNKSCLVIWAHHNGGNYDLVARHWTGGGFSAPFNVDLAAGDQTEPAVAGLTDSRFAAVYYDASIGKPVTVGIDPTALTKVTNHAAINVTGGTKPDIAASGLANPNDRFLVVFADLSVDPIAYRQYLASVGAQTGGVAPVNQVAGGKDGPVAVAPDGTGFRVVWYRDNGGANEFFEKTYDATCCGAGVATAKGAGCTVNPPTLGLAQGDANLQTHVVTVRGCADDVHWEYGANARVSNVVAEHWTPTIAYAPAASKYLMVWRKEASTYLGLHFTLGTRDAVGHLSLSPTGGQELSPGDLEEPAAAFEATDLTGTSYFAVVWRDGSRLKYTSVTAAGAVGFAPPKDVGAGTFPVEGGGPEIACLGGYPTRRCLVVYSDNSDVKGILTGYPGGQFAHGLPFTIAGTADTESEPAVVAEGTRYLVAWKREPGGASSYIQSSMVDAVNGRLYHRRDDGGACPCAAPAVCIGGAWCQTPGPIQVTAAGGDYELQPSVATLVQTNEAAFVWSRSSNPAIGGTHDVEARPFTGPATLGAIQSVDAQPAGDQKLPRVAGDYGGVNDKHFRVVYLDDYDNDPNAVSLILKATTLDTTGAVVGNKDAIYTYPHHLETLTGVPVLAIEGTGAGKGIVAHDGPLESICRPRLALVSTQW